MFHEDISYIARACSVFCDDSDVLKTIQLASIYNDSKTFVDMPMKYDPEIVVAAFYNISDVSDKSLLKEFLLNYFEESGSDLEQWVPNDYNDYPRFLSKISNKCYQQWAYELNQLWLTLGRRIKYNVYKHPQRHSYLPRYYPMIVPGGRFHESYYWDSYWIIRGLLVCDMHVTAKYVMNNLLSDIQHFGFIPNGGRIYYLDRSQPPMLSEMIVVYMDYMVRNYGYSRKIYQYIQKAYKLLHIEYNWWMNATNGHVVELLDKDQHLIRLNRYHSDATTPRPESYEEDYQQANSLLNNNRNYDRNRKSTRNGNSNTIDKFYSNIRAGAESGWDFSSRWIIPELQNISLHQATQISFELSNIDTSDIIPIDLNCILYRFELNMIKIAQFLNKYYDNYYHHTTTDSNKIQLNEYNKDITTFTISGKARKHGINFFMWDSEDNHWRDYNSTSHTFADIIVKDYKSIAYWIPMWAGIQPPTTTTSYDKYISYTKDNQKISSDYNIKNEEVIELEKDMLVESLIASDLLQVGGILTTNYNTGQQWDAPNAWPPLILFTIEGLQQRNTSSSLKLARELSSVWLNTCYVAYNNTGYMYEKYDAFHIGVGGGGGEYIPQIGFGWSNAVALILLNISDSNVIYNNNNNIITDISVTTIDYRYFNCDHFYYYVCVLMFFIAYILFHILRLN